MSASHLPTYAEESESGGKLGPTFSQRTAFTVHVI